MNAKKRRLAFLMSFTFVLIVAAVYLFLAISIVPYWQELSSVEVQSWFAGPFVRFSYMMVFVHLMSIGTTIWAFLLHRRSKQPHGMLWVVALTALLVCQLFNFTLFGGKLNPALQSGSLDAGLAAQTLDSWDVFHKIRTAFVCLSAFVMGMIFMRSTTTDTGR